MVNRRLRIYIAVIGCLTGCVVVLSVVALAARPEQVHGVLPLSALLVGVCWLLSRLRVHRSDSSSIVMGTIGQVAALLLIPLPLAILVIALAKILSEVSISFRRVLRKWRSSVVNTGGTVLANAGAGLAFHALRGQHYLWVHGLQAFLSFPGVVSLALVYHLVDALVVVGAISLKSNDPVWAVFRSLVKDMLTPMMSLTFVGITLAVMWHYNPALSLLMLIPITFTIRSFASVAQLRGETVEAVLKMAESIDYRDTGTYEHSQRLADFTHRLATSLGLIPEHISEIMLASRVHDLGKIGISNEILLKQGPLTPGERRTMEDHPVIGATILSSYSAFLGSVEIVKHHHERWDGKGYPAGLKGEEIPLGSRIISIVDAFDSMTADRPYRRGMSVEEAVERLKAGIGSQFDPVICAAFIQTLIDQGTYVPSEPVPDLHIVTVDAAV
jgi:HD-GYP domain-containing protein (c-di-GMP phosphodiesterase class II)